MVERKAGNLEKNPETNKNRLNLLFIHAPVPSKGLAARCYLLNFF